MPTYVCSDAKGRLTSDQKSEIVRSVIISLGRSVRRGLAITVLPIEKLRRQMSVPGHKADLMRRPDISAGYAAVAAIRNCLAFYPDRIDAIEQRPVG
jgi:hypothetical protein